MNNNIRDILKESIEVIETLENGKTYTSEYVVDRFEKAASQNPQDILISTMRDVLVKVASKKAFFTQKEIGKLYDHSYGLSGGQTAFRNYLEDLLPTDRQFAKIARTPSRLRKMEENPAIPIHSDSELSNAFSVLFSLGNDSSFSTYNLGKNKDVEKAVINKLSRMGYTPLGVDIAHTNDHFALCMASHKTSKLEKVSTLLPVQITGGIVKEPEHIIIGEEVVDLNERNLYLAIKESERNVKKYSQLKFSSERGDGSKGVEIEKKVVPKSLERFAEFKDALVASNAKVNSNQLNMALGMLHGELTSFGSMNPEISVASSDEKGLVFEAKVSTPKGRSSISIPVEFHNGMPILPSRFAAKLEKSSESIFDFDQHGFQSFVEKVKEESPSVKIARDTGPMSKMSYDQLMDRMIEGVASKDYKLAEDSLYLIEKRFGSKQFMVALDRFTELLKHSSDNSKRNELIKSAYERGELIRVPTSVELYCPKLGLPVSRVTFDEKGRVVAKGRRAKADQIQGTLITTNKIVLT